MCYLLIVLSIWIVDQYVNVCFEMTFHPLGGNFDGKFGGKFGKFGRLAVSKFGRLAVSKFGRFAVSKFGAKQIAENLAV